jgi:TetR/AcrR family transcriptional regulator
MEQSQEAILQAAMQEFHAKGFAGARMQRIADLCGLNKALIHYYFNTKTQLYQEILRYIMEFYWNELHQNLPNIAQVDDGYIYLKKLVELHFELFANYPNYTGIIMQEMASGGPFLHQLNALDKEISARGMQSVIKDIEQLMEKGKLHKQDAFELFLNVTGMCFYTHLAMPFRDAGFSDWFTHRSKEEHISKRMESILLLVRSATIAKLGSN